MFHGFIIQHRFGFLATSNVFHSTRYLLLTLGILLAFISVLLLSYFLDLVVSLDKLIFDILRMKADWEG